jgi:hypothetical protein
VNRVRSDGSILIERAVRDRLGVRPGREAVQTLRDGYLEIRFLPPAEAGASAGILGPCDAEWLRDEDALRKAIDQAFEDEMRERFPL